MSKKIIVDKDLRGFFFEKLEKINKKSYSPIPQEVIFYSSGVLEKYSNSDNFFDTTDGKVKEKLLGIKLLETQQLEIEKKKREIKDVAEMAMVLCGYFAKYQDSKIITLDYYEKLGKAAYSQLNSIEPEFLDVPEFFKVMADVFDKITLQMNHLSKELNQSQNMYEQYLISDMEKKPKS